MATKNLLDLNEDILNLILVHLFQSSPTSTCIFSSLSKTTQKLTNPIIWRTIKIGKGRDHKPHLRRDDIENLLDQRHFLLPFVREIKVRDVDASEMVITEWEMGEVIRRAKMLLKFNWSSRSPIPHDVLSALEKCWPSIILQVVHPAAQYRPDAVDTPLLSSPLLKNLTYNISWTRTSLFDEENENDTLSSQFEHIDGIFTRSTSIQVLDLGLDNMNSISNIPTAVAHEKKAIEHLKDASFSNIVSIQVPTDWGNANKSPDSHRILTSLLLSRVNKWKSVKELHLRGLHNQYAFKHLEGRVPNLRTLKLMFPSHYSNKGTLDPALVAHFLIAAEKLETLKIRDMDQAEFDTVWPAILNRKGTLKKLDLYARADWGVEAPVWDSNHLEEVYWFNFFNAQVFFLAVALLSACVSAPEQVLFELLGDRKSLSEFYGVLAQLLCGQISGILPSPNIQWQLLFYFFTPNRCVVPFSMFEHDTLGAK